MSPSARRRLSRTAKVAVPIAILGIILLVVGTVGFVEVSSQPWFCGSCHIMKPYHASWENSTHRDVSCIKCHIAPGIKAEAMTKIQAANMVVKDLTGTVETRPWAKVDDESCLRSGCHSTRLIQGEVEYKGVRFNHTAHLGQVRRGIQLHCTSCHSQIVQGSHIAVTENTCMLCHFKGRPPDKPVATCTGCHPSPPRLTSKAGFVVDHPSFVKDKIDCLSCHNEVVTGSGDADPERCVSCHNEPQKLAQTTDAPKLHRVHVGEQNIACVQCHTSMQHRIVSLAATPQLDCKSCHSNVHVQQQKLYAGVGGHLSAWRAGAAGPPDTAHAATMPSSMFQARVSCVGCHNNASRMPGHDTAQVANGTACMSCHGVRYANVLPSWQRGMERKVSLVDPVVQDAIAAARSLPVGRRALADSLLGHAADNVALVRAGKGVHNIVYADQLLRSALDLVRQAARDAHVPYRAPSVDLGPPVGENQCLQCHMGVETRQATFAGRTFSHGPHVLEAGLQCGACHTSFENHGGTLLTSAASCDNCHHNPMPSAARNCAQCHTGPGGAPTDTLHRPQGDFTHARHMTANVQCTACHAAPAMTATALDCDGCHGQHHQVQTACLSCHRGGALAKHAVSTAHAACSQCHKTVPAINQWTRQVCTACHAAQATHKPGRACDACHRVPSMATAASRARELR
jgi:nitrate/TMAO reductase-like tetraheme cytochrome c subunit